MTTVLASLLLSLQAVAPPLVPPPVLPPDPKPFYRAQHSPDCEPWRSARRGSVQEDVIVRGAQRLWVEGWITGFNFYGPDPTGDLLGSASWEEVEAFIESYCARHPSHAIADAMRPLAAYFLRRRPQPTRLPAAGAPPRLRAMAVMTATCADWNEDRDNRILRIVYGNYAVGGFLTAYNHWGPDPAGDVIGSGRSAIVHTWLDSLCRSQPELMLVSAVRPLLDHLAAMRAAGRLRPGGMRPEDELSPGSRDRP